MPWLGILILMRKQKPRQDRRLVSGHKGKLRIHVLSLEILISSLQLAIWSPQGPPRISPYSKNHFIHQNHNFVSQVLLLKLLFKNKQKIKSIQSIRFSNLCGDILANSAFDNMISVGVLIFILKILIVLFFGAYFKWLHFKRWSVAGDEPRVVKVQQLPQLWPYCFIIRGLLEKHRTHEFFLFLVKSIFLVSFDSLCAFKFQRQECCVVNLLVKEQLQ